MAEKVIAALVSTVLWVMRALPRHLLEPMGAGLGRLLHLLAAKDRRMVAENVKRVYRLPAGSHFSVMFERQVFRHHAICGLETIRAVLEPESMEVLGFEQLQAYVRSYEDQGLGYLLLTAHLGSWELCAYFGQKASRRPLSVLAKPPKKKALLTPLEAFRLRLGARILWTDQKTLLREMLGALKRGEGLGFVMDQKPDARRGPMVSFLGLPTMFVGGPASVCVRTQCPALALFCVREGPFRFRIVCEEVVGPNHGEWDEELLTQRFATVIERVIRLYPEQWTWNYKRWSRIPSTQP